MKYNERNETQLIRELDRAGSEELVLTSDLAFKAVFGRDRKECKQALKGLLNAILGTDQDQIKVLTFVNPFNPQEYADAKLSCMDIKLETESGTRISVEMQVAVGPVFIGRSIYYEAQLVTEELHEGENYDSMDRSIFIGILANNLFEGSRVHRKYRLKDVKSGEELSDLMELHFVELRKANKGIPASELSEVEQWALYLRYAGTPEHRELVEDLVKESEMIKVAENLRREISKDAELRARAFSRRLFEMDVNTKLIVGKREALEQGLELGREQGQLENRKLIAEKMLGKGMAVELISEVTELTIEEIQELSGGK